MYISHSVKEKAQQHDNPLTRVAFVYNGPKGTKLASNPRPGGYVTVTLVTFHKSRTAVEPKSNIVVDL